ncbi:MAG TPA: RNA polymerase sigma factor [Vicinamibacterales bacterium]|jgi:RNA polymerase sigma-70 factor (ECF subfamily)
MTDDDSALIDQIRDGSERAFNVLIDRHQQAVRGFLRRLLADASDADDLAQETFMVAWTRPGSYRGDASVRSWLCAIAWRKARDAQRTWFRRRVREATWAGEVEQIAAAPSPESALVSRALAALPMEQRAAVILCLIQDFSHTEAAGILGTPLGTVKSHVARGKARLLAVLGGEA